ncbi:MAG: pseudouridine synthase [Candidatus Parcubacteria bacterium]|nr:pseudouridine synthase [Burkholderiales bacterium]
MSQPTSRPTNLPNPPPAAPGSLPPGERLQKLLAAAGFGSRREIETWITAGRVSVRGQVAKLGDRARPGDLILLDGKEVKIGAGKGTPRVIIYHKPIGELVTRSDPEGRATVFEKLPKLSPGRWVSIGRLDLNSSGLLLFTDSGELANQLMHPRREVEREYEVRVQGGLSVEAIQRLLAGIDLEDGPAKFKSIEALPGKKDGGTNRWYRAVLAEGRNREVRRMVEAAGGRVSRLMRVRFGCIALPGSLAPGRCLEVDAGLTRKLTLLAQI